MNRDDRACVFDVQRFSVHDGPGIRTVVFFKGCALDCAWCHNPEAVRRPRELAYWSGRCLEECRACLEHCPEEALRDQLEQRVDWLRCSHCGLCVEPCPTGALTMIGREVGPEELLHEVLRDQDFFVSSGGGLTLSGGEPVLHSAFLQRFLPLARQKGLHVVMETAGAVPWRLLEPLLELVDVVFYDFKFASALRHRAYTRRDNLEILANLKRLLDRSRERSFTPVVRVRMPVVPGINSGDAEIAQAAAVLRTLRIEQLVLLPYNRLWEAKLPALDTRRQPLGIPEPEPQFYERLRERFAALGITAIL